MRCRPARLASGLQYESAPDRVCGTQTSDIHRQCCVLARCRRRSWLRDGKRSTACLLWREHMYRSKSIVLTQQSGAFTGNPAECGHGACGRRAAAAAAAAAITATAAAAATGADRAAGGRQRRHLRRPLRSAGAAGGRHQLTVCETDARPASSGGGRGSCAAHAWTWQRSAPATDVYTTAAASGLLHCVQ